ncbi:MAG: alpha/beta hydrolase [Paracoccaceae bacterium]
MGAHPSLLIGQAGPKGDAQASLTLPDGVRLAFRSFVPRQVSRGVVLVLHGSGLNAGYYLTLGGMLAARGYHAALMDFRGHGDSSGPRGDAPDSQTYREDLRQAVAAWAVHGPVHVLAHSGSAVVAIDLLSQPDAPDVAGLALVAPTIAGTDGLTRTATPRRNWDASLRYGLPFRLEAAVDGAERSFAYSFRFGLFLLGRLTGMGRFLRVLSFASNKPGEPPFRYTGRAAANMMATGMAHKLSRLRCPVFLATSAVDPYVNGAAIATILPWLMPREVALTHRFLARGDHFTATLVVVPDLLGWLEALRQPVLAEAAA